jgi:hypothetical protein
MAPALRAEDVAKRYGRVQALAGLLQRVPELFEEQERDQKVVALQMTT